MDARPRARRGKCHRESQEAQIRGEKHLKIKTRTTQTTKHNAVKSSLILRTSYRKPRNALRVTVLDELLPVFAEEV
jgi:hypothetical protein